MITQSSGFLGSDVSRVEVELQERVARARRDYERALGDVRKLAAELRNGPPGLNGSATLVQALQYEHVVTRRYSEALRALSEFVLGQVHNDDCA